MARNEAKPGYITKAHQTLIDSLDDSAISFAQLEQALAALAPAEIDRPESGRRQLAHDRAQRVAELALRAELGLALFCRRDVVHLRLPDKRRRRRLHSEAP